MQPLNVESNRRSTYRVLPPASENMRLTIASENTEGYIPDEVGDVSIKGVSMRFTKGRSPSLKEGAHVSLAVESRCLNGRAEVSARVVYAGENPTSRLIRLEFEEPMPLVEISNRDSFRIFNRRGDVRGVTPASVEEFDAQILPNVVDGLQRLLPVAIRNISMMGACLAVATLADNFIEKNQEFAVSLRIPGATGADVIAVRSCYRAQDETGIHYGCAFNWQETSNAFALIEKLNNYMLDRFEAELHETRH